MYYLTIKKADSSELNFSGTKVGKLVSKVVEFIKNNPLQYKGHTCVYEEI